MATYLQVGGISSVVITRGRGRMSVGGGQMFRGQKCYTGVTGEDCGFGGGLRAADPGAVGGALLTNTAGRTPRPLVRQRV